MKKTLLAIAALSAIAAAPAMAQSSVQIYGQVESAISKSNDGTSFLSGVGGTGQAKSDVYSLNGLNSRLGFKGTEDLGGGLKALFQLEHRFTTDDGAQNGAFFHGRSIVGLSGGFGEITLGRDYSPVYGVAQAADPFAFDATVGQLGAFHQYAGYGIGTGKGAFNANGGNRVNNAVTYTSPTFNGFTGKVSVAAGETAGLKRELGASLAYASGPLAAAVGYDQFDSDNNLLVVSASYDLGYVKPLASYSQSKVAGVKRDNVTLGATAPLGNGFLKAAVARFSTDTVNGAGADVDTTKFALGYEYTLSKRTSVFTDLGSAKGDNRTRTTALDVGLRHKF